MGNINTSRVIVNNRSNQSWSANSQDEDGFFIFKVNAWDGGLEGIGVFIFNWIQSAYTSVRQLQFNYEASNGTDAIYLAHDGTVLTSIWDDFADASVPQTNLSLSDASWQVGDEITIKIRGQFDFFRLNGANTNSAQGFFDSSNLPAQMTKFEIVQWGANKWQNKYQTLYNIPFMTCSAVDAPKLGDEAVFGYFLIHPPASFFTSQEAADALKFGIEYDDRSKLRTVGIFTPMPNFTIKPKARVLDGGFGERLLFHSELTPNSISGNYDWKNSSPSELDSAFCAQTLNTIDLWNAALIEEDFEYFWMLDTRGVENAKYMAFGNFTLDFSKFGHMGFTTSLTNANTMLAYVRGDKMRTDMSNWNFSNVKSMPYAFTGAKATSSYTGNADNGVDTINGVTITARGLNGQGDYELIDAWAPTSLPFVGGDNADNYEWHSVFYHRHSLNSSDFVREDWVSQSKYVACFKDMLAECYSLNQDLSLWDYSGVNLTKSFAQSSSNEMLGEFIRDCVGMSDENLEKLLVKWSLDASEGGLPDLNEVGSEIGSTSETIVMGTYFDLQSRTANQTMKDAFDIIEAKGFTISGMDYVRNYTP